MGGTPNRCADHVWIVVRNGLPLYTAFIYLFRLFEFTMILPESSYLVLTFVFALFPILNFALIFFVILTGFAIIAYAQFGATYPQFGSLGKSIWALCLYSFGFGEQSHAEDLVQPFVEEDGLYVQCLLLGFNILVVTLLLNMFTTIVIDAYNLAIQKTSTQADLDKLKAAISYQLKCALGYADETEEEVALLGQKPGRIFMRLAVAREEDFQAQASSRSLIDKPSIRDYKAEIGAMASRMQDIMSSIEKEQQKQKPASLTEKGYDLTEEGYDEP
eukprot:GHVN01020866.1.p1 GENE.GHVN01020866.1~~GHVN01020866.1.p1  ORF type:complete len:274 (+),score=19.51 GHVN01020866.1:326-1147(+)